MYKWQTVVLGGWEAIKQIYSAVNVVDKYLITWKISMTMYIAKWKMHVTRLYSLHDPVFVYTHIYTYTEHDVDYSWFVLFLFYFSTFLQYTFIDFLIRLIITINYC